MAFSLGPFFNLNFLWNNHCDNVGLERVSVNENLLYDVDQSKSAFKFIRSDVFSLLKLKDILLSINDP
jgi:hypothetical protein